MSIYNVGLIHQGRNQATYIFKCIELKIFRFCSTKIQASLKMFAHTHTHRNTGTYLMEERKLENYVDMREMKKFRCLFSEIWMIWHSQECFLSHSIVRCTNRMESQWFELIYLLKGYLKSRDRTDCENRSIYWATLCHRLELVQHWTWLTSAKLNIKCLSSFKWIENRMHIQIKLEIIFHQRVELSASPNSNWVNVGWLSFYSLLCPFVGRWIPNGNIEHRANSQQQQQSPFSHTYRRYFDVSFMKGKKSIRRTLRKKECCGAFDSVIRPQIYPTSYQTINTNIRAHT